MDTLRERFLKALIRKGWTQIGQKGGRWVLAHPDHGRNHYILGPSGSVRYGTAHSNSRAVSDKGREKLLTSLWGE